MASEPQPASTDDHEWYHSEGDEQPIPKQKEPPATSGITLRITRPRVGNNPKLTHAIEFEKVDEYGQLVQRFKPHKTKCPRQSKRPRMDIDDAASDPDDGNYTGDTESSSSASDEEVIPSNVEVAEMLPSKTIPETGRGSSKRKRSDKASVGKVVDNHSHPASKPQPLSRSGSTQQSLMGNEKTKRTTNPIYYFYEPVDVNSQGKVGESGDRHYKCLHGHKKVLTVTRKMKYSLNGLVGNLKSASPPMYCLYEALKERKPDQITEDEIAIAAGQKVIDDAKITELIGTLQSTNQNIRRAFEKQREAATAPWDQSRFEDLISNWIIATDQPFSSVDDLEFREMLTYAHHPNPDLKIPHRDGIKRRVMKKSEDGIAATKQMFQDDVDGKISISLDAWTSSNNYAFLAIIAHYITKTGHLEELLIDFRELKGEHSGANMADAVWQTLKFYGIENRFMAAVCDNASNNDTLIDNLVALAGAEGIYFNKSWIRLRCMPHTIHLAALKLLEGIGAISSLEVKKAASPRGNYQDNVTAKTDILLDGLALPDEIEEVKETPNTEEVVIIPAVDKLRKTIRAVRSSPQRQQKWLAQVASALQGNGNGTLILDVKTRWGSTDDMMQRALTYQKEIDDFVARNRDMRAYELSAAEWDAIEQVSGWLHAFRSATLQMSSTKHSMLSTTHAIFRGLQAHIKEVYASLAEHTLPQIKSGLLAAYRKLSDYYHKFDESPFYIWAALLDPRISYEGLKQDYVGDDDLLNYLASSKTLLQEHYNDEYANRTTASSHNPEVASQLSAVAAATTTMNFTSRYKKKDNILRNELEEYFKLPREDFDSCDPLTWWRGRQAQFPNLFCLARDILTIPGSAVAVERIFSGGRDTISLRRASLHPDTIRMLMISKQRLRLSRTKINKKL